MSKQVLEPKCPGCRGHVAVEDTKTCPLSKEDIFFIDNALARFYLVAELVQIPEFCGVWAQARQTQELLITAVKPRLEAVGSGLSPDARGALIMGESACGLYDRATLLEAEVAAGKISDINTDLRTSDYHARLQTLTEPLAVPGMMELMEILDYVRGWGLHHTLQGPIAGPASDLLEAFVIRGLTELSPSEAMAETRAQIARRIGQKVSPLMLHMERYGLAQRIQLWVQNVVYGESIFSIADRLQRSDARDAPTEPGEWVRQQVREASRILGVKRVSGRPRKGGVLRYWKLMV